ncbi:ATP-binding protein Cassette (ABC) superfamily [Angomonas deanei]|nr:ATP-binding protein Cassette (ABC) superfamily [Angomonas deanei]EPY41615.1 ATP-binding protein Cassette (ABC) superfamily [Angomonas deanei]|eukprot:EPY26467.1 ATP-binding protein Cassette (ABC) superfamily [Angomonas deanei]
MHRLFRNITPVSRYGSGLLSLRHATTTTTGTTDTPTSIVIGDPKNGTTDPVRVSWTDMLGVDGINKRLSAGPLLSMLDFCAYRVAEKVSSIATKKTGTTCNSCTVAVNNTGFVSPVLHGDTVRMDGRVIHAGGSSLGIYIRFYRTSPTTRIETAAGESFFTMVLITPELKSAKVAPAMTLTDPFDIQMHMRYNSIRESQKRSKEIASRTQNIILKPEDVDGRVNKDKRAHVRIESTKITANRIFLSSYLNNNNTVFGGEIMSWMEKHAVHCGRMFVGNQNVYTIGMHSVYFPEPIFSSDWVSLEAHVVYVRNTTMEVDVVLRAERKLSGAVITNRASFVLINNNDIGQKAIIPYGIEFGGASQQELQDYMAAKVRYHRRREYRDAFKYLYEDEIAQMKEKSDL